MGRKDAFAISETLHWNTKHDNASPVYSDRCVRGTRFPYAAISTVAKFPVIRWILSPAHISNALSIFQIAPVAYQIENSRNRPRYTSGYGQEHPSHACPN